MRLLRLLFGNHGPHRDTEAQAEVDLREAQKRNREAIKRNVVAVEKLERTVREKETVEGLADGVLREMGRK